MLRRSFRAMGTDVELVLDTGDRALATLAFADAEADVRRLESELSRFRPQSELSRLNAAGRLRAGAALADCLRLALDAREATGGRFDPTIHDALVAAGYDRPFDELRGASPCVARNTRAPAARGGVLVDDATGEVVLEPGVRVDLGGIAKGYAADRVARRLGRVAPALASLGGDLAVAGVPAEGAWGVGVETPGGELALAVRSGGLATSGVDRRSWRAGGEERHHIVDPATGRPAETDLLRVTVLAASAAAAEAHATALLLAGADAARAEAEELALDAVLVTRAGDTVVTGALA